MGTQVPLIHVWNSSDESLMERYDRVEFLTRNSFKIYFDTALAGKVVMTANVCSGSPAKYILGTTGANEVVIPNAEAYAMVTTAGAKGLLYEYDSAVCTMDDRTINVVTTPSGDPLLTQIIAAIDKIHYQLAPATSWNIPHYLNTEDVIVRCFTSAGEALPGTITIVDEDNIRFDCDSPMAGYAMIKGYSWFPQTTSDI
jgi:hypothetical protein